MDIFDLHQGLPREAPGSDEATLRALRLVPELPAAPRILDIGCGPGAQTLVLARETNGTVTAVDIHQPYLDELERRARAAGLARQITTVRASMQALPFEPASFDLIWGEGSIYIAGFEAGLRCWTRFVRPGGSIVVSELTWLTAHPPQPARDFWNGEYPAMKTLAENRAIVERCGLTLLADFVLPRVAWFADYYDPLSTRIAALAECYRDDGAALQLLERQRAEIDIVRRHGDSFGYAFFLARRNGPARVPGSRCDERPKDPSAPT